MSDDKIENVSEEAIEQIANGEAPQSAEAKPSTDESPEIEPISPYEGAGIRPVSRDGYPQVNLKYSANNRNAIGISPIEPKLTHVMKQIKDSDLSDSTGNAVWGESLERAMPNTSTLSEYHGRISDEEADWTESLEYQGRDIRAVSPSSKRRTGRAQGKAAVLQVNAMLGLGSVVYIPLPHSCMYLSIRVASLSEMLDLEYQLVTSKIDLGRYTMGASFSADEATRVRIIMRMILRHTYESSIQTTDVDELLDVIKVSDYPIIMKEMARNIFPKGYELFQPCIKDPRTCTNVISGMVDFGRMTWYDRSRFSDSQLKALVNPRGSQTVDEVRALQAEHAKKVDPVISIGGGLRATLKVPTLREFFETSNEWFETMVSSIDESLGLSNKERNVYLLQTSRLQEANKYHHWIKRISWDGDIDDIEATGEGFMDSPEDIAGVLSGLSEEPKLRDELFTKINEFIAKSTVAIVGIPDYACPVCGKHYHDEKDTTGIIPVNMVNVFTTLVTQNLVKANQAN